jgi:hypothetical protein
MGRFLDYILKRITVQTIYNGEILGFEIDGKRHLMVLRQLWTFGGELTQLYY